MHFVFSDYNHINKFRFIVFSKIRSYILLYNVNLVAKLQNILQGGSDMTDFNTI